MTDAARPHDDADGWPETQIGRLLSDQTRGKVALTIASTSSSGGQ